MGKKLLAGVLEAWLSSSGRMWRTTYCRWAKPE